MIHKIYPPDQMEKYMLIDVIALLFLVYRLFMDSSIHLLEKLIFIALYLFAYYISLWHRDWRLLAGSVAGCLLLAFMSMKAGVWILLYGFIFAHLLGRAERNGHIAAGMAGIALMFILHGWMHEGSLKAVFAPFYLPVMLSQLATPLVVSVTLKTNVLKEKLDIANAQLERYIQEEERHRIARDLHDTLGQTLTMIKLKSELALRLVDQKPELAKKEIDDILHSSMQALKQAGEIVSDMKHISLKQEIEHTKDVLQKAGIQLVAAEPAPLLSRAAETMLALSIREAVTNVMKHSGASRCVIEQFEQDGYYVVQVRDNGNGQLSQGKGNGLQSMKERMAMLQGDAEMSAVPGQGSEITFKVPLASNRR